MYNQFVEAVLGLITGVENDAKEVLCGDLGLANLQHISQKIL